MNFATARLPASFYDRRDALAGFLVAANMLVVAGAGILAYRVDHALAYVLAFLVVGARGQACYVLQHEAMHNLLFSNRKTNEYVGIVLSAFLGSFISAVPCT